VEKKMMSIAGKKPIEEKRTFQLIWKQNIVKTSQDKKDKEDIDMDSL
jgi:hypothetical protein